jgi:hypothetical protein
MSKEDRYIVINKLDLDKLNVAERSDLLRLIDQLRDEITYYVLPQSLQEEGDILKDIKKEFISNFCDPISFSIYPSKTPEDIWQFILKATLLITGSSTTVGPNKPITPSRVLDQLKDELKPLYHLSTEVYNCEVCDHYWEELPPICSNCGNNEFEKIDRPFSDIFQLFRESINRVEIKVFGDAVVQKIKDNQRRISR